MVKKITLFLIGLLLASSAQAATNWQRRSFFNNAGGLNDSAAEIAIADNEAADLQNVVFTTSGNIKTRDGYDNLNSLAISTTLGLAYYEPISGTKYILAVFDDNTIRKMDYNAGGGPDGTFDDITGALTFTTTSTTYASFAIGEDTAVIEDGINTTAPYKWSGTGNASALGGSPPNATMVAYHKRHMFAAGNDTYPSTLYYSDLGDIEDWTGGISGDISIETNDGSIIRAIVPGYDAIYIWKDSSIWRVTGDDKDTFQLQRMISGVGCRSPGAVSRIGNDFVFISDQGDIYLYDGALTLTLLSKKIDTTLSSTNSAFDRFQYAQVEVLDNDAYISISSVGQSTHDTILYLDTYHMAWSKFAGINANVMAIADDGNGEDMLIFGDYSGYVHRYPYGTNDNGTAIDASFTTKQYFFPELSINKVLEKEYIYANQKGDYNLNIETRSDFETTGKADTMSLLGETSSFGTARYGVDRYGGQNIVIEEIEPDKQGKFFQLKFYNSNLDEPFEIKGWDLLISQSEKI